MWFFFILLKKKLETFFLKFALKPSEIVKNLIFWNDQTSLTWFSYRHSPHYAIPIEQHGTRKSSRQCYRVCINRVYINSQTICLDSGLSEWWNRTKAFSNLSVGCHCERTHTESTLCITWQSNWSICQSNNTWRECRSVINDQQIRISPTPIVFAVDVPMRGTNGKYPWRGTNWRPPNWHI